MRPSVRDHLFDLLSTNSTLQTLSGGTVRAYPLSAPDGKVQRPYIVYALPSLKSVGQETYPLASGLITIHVIDFKAERTRANAIVRRIKAIIKPNCFESDDGRLLAARIFYVGDDEEPGPSQDQTTDVILFQVRGYDQGLYLDRSGS